MLLAVFTSWTPSVIQPFSFILAQNLHSVAGGWFCNRWSWTRATWVEDKLLTHWASKTLEDSLLAALLLAVDEPLAKETLLDSNPGPSVWIPTVCASKKKEFQWLRSSHVPWHGTAFMLVENGGQWRGYTHLIYIYIFFFSCGVCDHVVQWRLAYPPTRISPDSTTSQSTGWKYNFVTVKQKLL